MFKVGEYVFDKNNLLGKGGFGKVYKGKNTQTAETVAVKEMKVKTPSAAQMVQKELTVLTKLAPLRHTNLVAMYVCYVSDHRVYLVMEYCNGGDLADYLRSNGALGERTTRGFLGQLARGMRVVYDNSIMHRDLKPQNIMVTYNANQQITLKITDFGIAKVLEQGVVEHTPIGTALYMAPEVHTQVYNAKVDLWSLGLIVYECLTGRLPNVIQPIQPQIPRGTSDELGQLLNGLLKRNPKERMAFKDFFNHPVVR